MFFTQEDYKKIEEWLSRNAVRDTEFNEAAQPFEGNEIISFVQNGHNTKAYLKDFVNQLFLLGIPDFVNITEKFDESNISLSRAIQLIPYKSRKIGQVITFLNEEGVWKIYQFKGKRNNQWNEESLWIDLIRDIASKITTLADEEDITIVEENGANVFKFKDKTYNPDNFSGKGYKILRKNIIDNKNILTQEMINEENTVYEVRYDFDLNGAEITIPEGCNIKFNSGKFKNGKVKGYLSDSNFLIDNFGIKNNDETYDCSPIIKDILTTTKHISLEKDKIYYINSISFDSINDIIIDGNGAILKMLPNLPNYTPTFNFTNCNNIVIKNIVLDGNKDNEVGDEQGGIGDNNFKYCNNIELSNIKIQNTKRGNIILMGCKNVLIDNILNDGGDVGVMIPGTNLDRPSEHITIRNSEFFGGTSEGVSVYDNEGKEVRANNILIDNCIFIDKGTASISYGQVNNLMVKNCYFKNNNIEASELPSRIISQSVDNFGNGKVSFVNNYFDSILFYIPNRKENNLIINNNIFDSSVVSIHNSSDNKVQISENLIYPGLHFKDDYCIAIGNVVFSNNTIINKYITEENLNMHVLSLASNRDGDVIGNTFINSKYTDIIIRNSTTLRTCNIYDNINAKIKRLAYQPEYDNLILGKNIGTTRVVTISNYGSIAYQGDDTIIINSNEETLLKIGSINTFSIKENTIARLIVNCELQILSSQCIFPLYGRILHKGDILDIQYINGKWTTCNTNIFIGSSVPSDKTEGLLFYNTNTKKPSWWNGNTWINADGNDSSYLQTGTFSQKPSNPPIGFAYFCTNKQTAEGATNGIMIYHKGEDVWVDALGRVIS